MWTRDFNYNGQTARISNCDYDPNGACILLSPDHIRAVSGKELTQLLRAFVGASDDLAVIGLACEMDYDAQYVSDDDLAIIMSSPHATDTDKQLAFKEKRKRDNPALARKLRIAEEELEQARRNKRPGYIYLIRADNSLFKIGKTINPEDRFKSLQTLSPVPLALIHTVKTGDTMMLEHELHERFSEKREQGEWFKLEPADVDFIKSL